MSNWAELSLKDKLKNWYESFEMCVCNLCYLYKKSTKKLRELKALYDILFEMYAFSYNRVKANCAIKAGLIIR